MPYKVVVWCEDCYLSDFDGCFDGLKQYILVDPDNGDPIRTLVRGDHIGWLKTHDVGPWTYKVVHCLDIPQPDWPALKREWQHDRDIRLAVDKAVAEWKAKD